MGHAGAIIRAFGESAAEKVEIMRGAGITVVSSPADLGSTTARGAGPACRSAWRSARERASGRGRDPPPPRAGAQALAREFDARLNPEDRPLTADGLQEALRSADALLTTVTDKVTAEVLAAEPRRAKLVANFGVGFNNIDVEAAKARGIAVSNTPDVLTDATADLAMTLLLMMARRTGEGERHVRGGALDRLAAHPHARHAGQRARRSGLIGMGRIARAVAQRAHHGFGMKVIFHDPYPARARGGRGAGRRAAGQPRGGAAGGAISSRSTVRPRPRPVT